jgi:hypothetical protein
VKLIKTEDQIVRKMVGLWTTYRFDLATKGSAELRLSPLGSENSVDST